MKMLRESWRYPLTVCTALLLAPVQLLLLNLTLLGVCLVPAAGAGFLLWVPSLWGIGLMGSLERSRLLGLTGVRIQAEAPSPGSHWRRVLFDRQNWRSAAYLAIQAHWAIVTGTAIVGALSAALAAVIAPFVVGFDGPLHLFGRVTVQGTGPMLALIGGALAVGVGAWLMCRPVTVVTLRLAQFLLGADPAQQVAALSSRVESLTTTRQEAVDSVEAERLRIERDLHDGPQQRLVAVAMDLGMARDALGSNPERASELLNKAHTNSKAAILEMRNVARGIVPPILSDRGLSVALATLTANAATPVTVDDALPADLRLNPTIEAIAYFCVSEALTNVAKHAKAQHCHLRLALDQRTLVLTIRDHGVGGAEVGSGTGLVGLQQRARSVDGQVTITSPQGGPTVLTVRLPLPTTTPTERPQ